MFKDKMGTKILSNDLIWDVMDEIRSERKILMVLKNDNTENYVSLDLADIDIANYQDDKSLSQDVFFACSEKVRFRKRMAVEKVGILRLDYILKVMRKVFFEKANIANPESYKAKLKSFEKAEIRLKQVEVESNQQLQ